MRLDKTMEFMKEMAPGQLESTGPKVDGEKATLEATGKVVGEPNAGTILLEEEGGQWKVVTIEAFAFPPFQLGRTPVTNAGYAPCVAAGRVEAPPWWGHPGFCAERQPVVGVTWEDAMAFCAWLGDTEGGLWRLPSETEWELAMSGGLPAPRTPWGDAVPEGEIPEGPLAGPWEVGRGTPNGHGLCDPGTVVHEWCLDWREPGKRRASRGGSWRHAVRWSAPSARSSLPPHCRYSDFGFRVLRELSVPGR